MSSAPPAFVVTCPVPPGSSERLHVEVVGRTVIAVGPDRFRHTFELPPGVAVERLAWEVYANVLEIRAPFLARDVDPT